MRKRATATILAPAVVLLAFVASAVVPQAVAAASPPTVAAESYPVMQGNGSPIGDVTVNEASVGQLTATDQITFRFSDSASAATFHIDAQPTVAGTQGLVATAAVASSSGSLHDEVIVTIQTPSSGSFPGNLTLTGLDAAVDGGAASGNNNVTVSDSASVIASSGSPVTVSDANAIGSVTPHASYAQMTKPGIDSTGLDQPAGDLTLTEPAKIFFKTGDVITFTIRDSLGSRDTVGLAGAPTASGGGMIVHVQSLSGGTVQPNDTAFQVVVDQQDPSNGSASAITITNIAYNTGQAPAGPVVVAAKVTAGSSSEYIYPGRVTNAVVGGSTSTTSAGRPVVQTGVAGQPAADLTVAEVPGTLKATTTFSIAIQEPGVTFSSAPLAAVTNGNLMLASPAATLDGTDTTATWTVQAASTVPSTIVIAPIDYDVASSGPSSGDAVNLLAGGGAGSGFTTQTVSNAEIAPTGQTLFTGVTAPSTPGSAGDVSYQEVGGARAPTGGSIVLLSPYRTQTLAYRGSFLAVPTAVVTPGSGLVLGPGSVNTTAITIVTPSGTLTAKAETAAIFPVTTGSSSPATVTFGNISYQLGSLVPPGALVATGVVDTGANGTGTNVSGNDFVNAVNPVPPGWGVNPSPSPSPSPTSTPSYQPDAQVKVSTSASYVGDNVYGTATGQTVSAKLAPGKKLTVDVLVQNDGNTSDGFTIKGTGNQSGFSVRYFQGVSGTTDITSQVEAGTYSMSGIAPAASDTIRLVIAAKKSVPAGTRKSWTVSARSAGDASKTDLVKVKVKAT